MLENIWNRFLLGMVMIIIGIMITILNIHLYTSLIQLLVFAFLLYGVIQLCSILRKKEFLMQKFFLSLLNILFAITMNIFPNIPLSIIPILFSIYLLLNGIMKGIGTYLLWKNGQNKWKELFLFIFFLITGLSFLFAPIEHLPTFLILIGIYFIMIGLSEWKSVLLSQLPFRFQKRTFRLTLPTFLDAFIPRRMLNKINHYFNDTNLKEEKISKIQKENTIPDLEIFIHVAPTGFNQLGHMDIYFDGSVISYGNYDTSSYRMFDSIGDGVLFETSKEKYIPFCIQQSNKTLIGFGLKLTELQKERVKKEIEMIKKDTYPWEPNIIKDQQKKQIKEKKEYSYIDLLYLKTNASIYKFKTGEFKTYFVLGRNCTLFADRIVGKSGTDIIKMVGIITPGAYLDYLEHEFLRKNSMVICRNIYNKVTNKKHFKKN